MAEQLGTYPPARVVPYDPAWTGRYAELRDRLSLLMGTGCRLEHVGSTSVPGMLGKPVIDVAIGLPPAMNLHAAREVLAGDGWVGWVPVANHRATFLLDAAGVRVAVAHVYAADQWDTADLRVFGAWLRSHPEDRDAYAQAKLALVKAGVWGLAYTTGKAPLVQLLTDRAHAELRDAPLRPDPGGDDLRLARAGCAPTVSPDTPTNLKENDMGDTALTDAAPRTLADTLLDHEFTTGSNSRKGINTRHAGCTCGAEHEWYDREALHKKHLEDVTVAWAEEQTAARMAPLVTLVEAYAEETHSDECGFGPCVRCVVDEFAKRITPADQAAPTA